MSKLEYLSFVITLTDCLRDWTQNYSTDLYFFLLLGQNALFSLLLFAHALYKYSKLCTQFSSQRSEC